jgi:hypothetical protein
MEIHSEKNKTYTRLILDALLSGKCYIMRSLVFEPIPDILFKYIDENSTYEEHLLLLISANKDAHFIVERFNKKKYRIQESLDIYYLVVRNAIRRLKYIIDKPEKWKNLAFIMQNIYLQLMQEEISVIQKPFLSHYQRGIIVSMICMVLEKYTKKPFYLDYTNDELFQMSKIYIRKFKYELEKNNHSYIINYRM